MDRPKILAYYFPDWHADPRNAQWFGQDWSEWKLLEAARPRYDGHRQPRVPIDGPFDEASPAAAERQIRLAKEYGVDGFLVDYYWYDDGPYLQAALDDGLLAARNSDDVKFALMWANHELVDIFPHDDPSNDSPQRLKNGAIDRTAFEKLARHVIDTYFARPNYLTVDGRPWLTIYELGNLIVGLGGVDETADALQWFDEQTRQAGFEGLHLDAVIWGVGVLPRRSRSTGPPSWCASSASGRRRRTSGCTTPTSAGSSSRAPGSGRCGRPRSRSTSGTPRSSTYRSIRM